MKNTQILGGKHPRSSRYDDRESPFDNPTSFAEVLKHLESGSLAVERLPLEQHLEEAKKMYGEKHMVYVASMDIVEAKKTLLEALDDFAGAIGYYISVTKKTNDSKNE